MRLSVHQDRPGREMKPWFHTFERGFRDRRYSRCGSTGGAGSSRRAFRREHGAGLSGQRGAPATADDRRRVSRRPVIRSPSGRDYRRPGLDRPHHGWTRWSSPVRPTVRPVLFGNLPASTIALLASSGCFRRRRFAGSSGRRHPCHRPSSGWRGRRLRAVRDDGGDAVVGSEMIFRRTITAARRRRRSDHRRSRQCGLPICRQRMSSVRAARSSLRSRAADDLAAQPLQLLGVAGERRAWGVMRSCSTPRSDVRADVFPNLGGRRVRWSSWVRRRTTRCRSLGGIGGPCVFPARSRRDQSATARWVRLVPAGKPTKRDGEWARSRARAAGRRFDFASVPPGRCNVCASSTT